MSDILKAPWDSETVQALNEFQRSGAFHGYTCNEHTSVLLCATESGWVCPRESCGYTQGWAHAFSADPQVVEAAREQFRRILGQQP